MSLAAVPSLADEETLLRRFDPHKAGNVIWDEGEHPKPHLTAAALRFDSDGCSVHREEILTKAGIDLAVLRHPDYPALAATEKVRVEFDHESQESTWKPFSAVESPRDDVIPEEVGRAHASIVETDCGISRTQLRKAKSVLAQRAFTIVDALPRSG